MRIKASALLLAILGVVVVGCDSSIPTSPDLGAISPTRDVYACSSSSLNGSSFSTCEWYSECLPSNGCYDCDLNAAICEQIILLDGGDGSGGTGGGSTGGGSTGGGDGLNWYSFAYLPDELCQPRYDPRCKTRAPQDWEVTALRADLERIKNKSANCAQLAAIGTLYLEQHKVGFFTGPLQNADGDDSVGDNHDGQIHISTRGFWNGSEYPINTMADKARIFRHELKHRVPLTHTQMSVPAWQCD